MTDDVVGPLTVLIGAGASYDCVDREVTSVDPAYRPPLVDYLFQAGEAFNPVLYEYPGAQALSDDIRVARRNGIPLEHILRGLADEESLELRRLAWQVPLYLQGAIGAVSTRYVKHGATKFESMLIAMLRSKFRDILLLTMNYDLFLDRAIEWVFSRTLGGPDTYVWNASDRQWGYVKLHGSVHWGRRLRVPGQHQTWQSALAAVEGKLEVEEEIQHLKSHRGKDRFVGGVFHYPALSVPIAGKTEFVCPPHLIDYADRATRESTHLLVIGFSGLDVHVLARYVRHMGPLTAMRIVSDSNANGRETLHRILTVNKELDRPRDQIIFDGGFKDFVGGGALSQFLGSSAGAPS